MMFALCSCKMRLGQVRSFIFHVNSSGNNTILSPLAHSMSIFYELDVINAAY